MQLAEEEETRQLYEHYSKRQQFKSQALLLVSAWPSNTNYQRQTFNNGLAVFFTS